MNARELVEREVYYCVSMLVDTLAKGAFCFPADMRREQVELSDLAEQAFELSAPVADWEEAARQGGMGRAVAE